MSKTVTKAELASHNTPESLWIALEGKVYDVTKMHVSEHPGGPEPIKSHAGTDATEAFERVGHSEGARKWREDFLVGAMEKEVGAGGCCQLDENTVCLALAVGLPMALIITMNYFSGKN